MQQCYMRFWLLFELVADLNDAGFIGVQNVRVVGSVRHQSRFQNEVFKARQIALERVVSEAGRVKSKVL